MPETTPPWREDNEQHDGPFVILFRPHNELMMATRIFGPFPEFGAAYDALDQLPALGNHVGDGSPGVKYIEPLRALA